MAEFWIATFVSNIRVDTSLMGRTGFESFVNQEIQGLIGASSAHFQLVIPFVCEMFSGNLLPTAFNTDWTLEYGNESNGYLIRSVLCVFINTSCNCLA